MHLFRNIIAALLIILSPGLLPAETETPPSLDGVPTCFDGRIRISALIQTEGIIKVGLVDRDTGDSYLLGPGESGGGVDVVTADYESEQVVLERDGAICTLSLSHDPNAVDVAIVPPDTPPGLYRGDAIEQFLEEFPDALEKGLIKLPLQTPALPVQGKGPTIESYLDEHPELRAMTEMVVTGRGPGIERMLAEHPDMAVVDDVPEGSLGPGIEAFLKEHGTNNIRVIEIPTDPIIPGSNPSLRGSDTGLESSE